MIRWIILISAVFLGGKFTQDIVANHGTDFWIARGTGILTVAAITLIGHTLFLKPVDRARRSGTSPGHFSHQNSVVGD